MIDKKTVIDLPTINIDRVDFREQRKVKGVWTREVWTRDEQEELDEDFWIPVRIPVKKLKYRSIDDDWEISACEN